MKRVFKFVVPSSPINLLFIFHRLFLQLTKFCHPFWLFQQCLGCNPARIGGHEQFGEEFAIKDWLLHGTHVFGIFLHQRANHPVEVRLMEIGKRVALLGAGQHFMWCGQNVVVGDQLEHVAREADQRAGHGWHKIPGCHMLELARCAFRVKPVPGAGFTFNGRTNEEASFNYEKFYGLEKFAARFSYLSAVCILYF